jgi:hypothetical protein
MVATSDLSSFTYPTRVGEGPQPQILAPNLADTTLGLFLSAESGHTSSNNSHTSNHKIVFNHRPPLHIEQKGQQR